MTGKACRRGAALDSNCITYLSEALSQGYDPENDGDGTIRPERVALVRLLLYTKEVFVCPRSREQVEAIPDEVRLALQQWIGDQLLPELVVTDVERVDERVVELVNLHPDEDDCRILAEAELGRASILLTRDEDFTKRLGDTSAIPIRTPSGYWEDLNLPQGAKPMVVPHPTNPLGQLNWWRW